MAQDEQSSRANRKRNRLPKLKIALLKLDSLAFPALERPCVPRGSPPTRELVDWAVRMYCFSLLSHCREMLRSFLLLADTGHISAAFVIARCLFEMAAQSYYVHKHVDQYLRSKELTSAWKFLSEINMGSRYMNEYGGKKGNPGSSFPAVREVQRMIRAWEEWAKKDMRSMYSYLSEYAHPNMATFSHYYKMDATEERRARVRFSGPARNPLAAPLPEASMALVTMLHFGARLLEIASARDLKAELAATLKDLIEARRIDAK